MTALSFLAVWLLVQLLAQAVWGSGIPQLMAGIDLTTPNYEEKISRLLSLRIATTNAFYFCYFGVGDDLPAQRYFSPDCGGAHFQHCCFAGGQTFALRAIKKGFVEKAIETN